MPATATRGRTMSRLWTNDEELAKKDDDLTDPRLARQNHGHGHGHQWQGAGRVPRRRSVARFAVYALIAFLLIIVLTKALGGGGGGAPSRIGRPSSGRYHPDRIPDEYDSADKPPVPDSGAIPGEKGSPVEPARTYSGSVKLPSLGQSLHAIGSTGGKQAKNRNVLFAAGSLKSAATLLPFACQMAFEHLNYVHFVLMGRSEISLLDLLKINGIETTCPLILHGAVPPASGSVCRQ